MVEPKRVHWTIAKHVLRYLCGIVEYGLRYTWDDGVNLVSYTNADWVGNAVDKKRSSR